MTRQIQKMNFKSSVVMLVFIIFCILSTCDAGKTMTRLYLHREKDWIDRGLDILHGKWDSSENEVTVFGVTAGVGSSNVYSQGERQLFVLGLIIVGVIIVLGICCLCFSFFCQFHVRRNRSRSFMI